MFKKLGISAAVLAGLILLAPAAAIAAPRGRHWHGGPAIVAEFIMARPLAPIMARMPMAITTSGAFGTRILG